MRLALCDIEEERTTVHNDKILEIFVELRKLADTAEAKSPEERDFLEKFSVAMGTMQECKDEPIDFGDEFFHRMFEAGDVTGYDDEKRNIYIESAMNEYKAKMTLLEMTQDAREDGFAEGEAKGRAQGKAEGKAEAARAMLADRLPVETIMKYTGLTPEQIAAL